MRKHRGSNRRSKHRKGGSSSTPDDDASANTILLELTGGSSFFFEGASAVDDGRFTFFSIIDSIELELGFIAIGSDNETGKTTFTSGRFNIGDTIKIAYSGSGGVDSLVLSPVPVPIALPLFGAGLAVLGFAGWRKKRKFAVTV